MTSTDVRTMVHGLRETRSSAPEGMADAVLATLGLIDSWTELDGPIGPLFVAWGSEGVTAAERAGDPDGFELEYLARLGRPVRRVA